MMKSSNLASSNLAPESSIALEDNPAALTSEAAAGLTHWLNQGNSDSSANSANAAVPAVEEQRLLRFVLQGNESALLPLDSIQEVLQVPKRGLLRVPGMPRSVLGVSNCRGSILWMVDLAMLLGLETAPSASAAQPWQRLNSAQQSLNTITIQATGESLGLVVPEVMDIETHATRQIQPPSADLFSSQLLPFLAGYLTRSCSPVFSASALIEHLQLQRPSR